MDATAFKEYLENRYYDQLKYYSGAAKKNQKRYKVLQWVLIILSTLTTIMAALPHENSIMKYSMVVIAALVTILTAGLKAFQYQELWVSYRSTNEQLKPEIYFYNFNVGEYGQPGVDKESVFVDRVEKILNREHSAWPIYKKLMEQDKKKEAEDQQQKKTDAPIKDQMKSDSASK